MREGISTLVGQELWFANRGALRQRGNIHLETVGKGARHAGHDRQVHATTAPAVIGPSGEAASGFEVVPEDVPALHGREV